MNDSNKTQKPKGSLNDADRASITCASFKELIDLVTKGQKVFYLYKSPDGLMVDSSFTDPTGKILAPPEHEGVPFRILSADEILAHQTDDDHELYWDIFGRLKEISVLPSDKHYHLVTVYIFFTYLPEAVSYFPYLWFFGLPERGKSRILKAVVNLSYRGFYTETLNPAYLFRYAHLFHGTIGIDLYELVERAHRKDSYDLLLGRYEKGQKTPRVVAPEKGDFKDIKYYSIAGPTVLATNKEIPATDPLESRCIKITMPEARGKYPNNNSVEDLLPLRARLLAFRARHIDKKIPDVEKPTPGRLGDITHPLLCVAILLPGEASKNLISLIEDLEIERKEAQTETLAGKIAQALHDLQVEVKNGKLRVELVREKLNEGVDSKFQTSPQSIGRELSALGIKRRKSGGVMHVVCDLQVMQKIWERYGVS